MLHIDPADPDDDPARALLTQLTQDLAERYSGEGTDGAGHFATADVRQPRSVFLLAWFGTEAVGCGALRPFAGDPAGTAEIKRMFVQPSVRGQGIGREILAELERHARTFGYARVCLETGVRQPEAVALYQKAGYAPIPLYPPHEHDANSLCFAKNVAAEHARETA